MHQPMGNTSKHCMKKSSQLGFTLTELLVVIAIAAIIASIALPSYRDSVTRSRRAEGQALLLQIANILEQHYTRYNQYPTSINNDNPPQEININTVSASGYYTVQLVNGSGGSRYGLRAVPTGTHADNDCGNLTYNSLGERSQSETITNERCWQ